MATYDISTAAATLEFDTVLSQYNSCNKVDDNHFINFWSGNGSDGFVQVFTVNTSTWAVTTAAASLEFDTQNSSFNSCCKVDTNHFINFWLGGATTTDGFTQIFAVNTSTWAVTTINAPFLFDTDVGSHNSCAKIDDTHVINFWRGASADGFAQVFAINTTTWVISTAAAQFEFDTQDATFNACFAVDSNHFINFWLGGAATTDGFVQVFTVNTTTWAVSTTAASLLFDTNVGSHNTCFQIDSNHFINFWSGASTDGFTQVFEVNTTTWAVTTAGAQLEFDTQENDYNSCFQIDSTHFINFWSGNTALGFVQVFTVNTSTWAVTTAGAVLTFDASTGEWNSCYKIDTGHYINFWSGSGADGFTQVFIVDLSVLPNVKSYNTNVKANIKSIDTNLLANIKSLNTNA